MMTQKATLMILGSHHLDNPGRDYVNFQADDVLSAKRQREVRQLVALLKQFRPTKIAVENTPDKDADLEKRYQQYLAGDYELSRSEIEQLGFRLAREMGHSKVYPVDWFGDPPVDRSHLDFEAFAQAHNQEALLAEALAQAQADNTQAQEIQSKGSLVDLYLYHNQPERLRAAHQIYFTLARIGAGNRYPGAEWVQYWYGRNLKIFVNLTRITHSNDERILLIIGAGHAWLLQQFATDSGYYQIESPLLYLKQA
jgi:hypothetical protein